MWAQYWAWHTLFQIQWLQRRPDSCEQRRRILLTHSLRKNLDQFKLCTIIKDPVNLHGAFLFPSSCFKPRDLACNKIQKRILCCSEALRGSGSRNLIQPENWSFKRWINMLLNVFGLWCCASVWVQMTAWLLMRITWCSVLLWSHLVLV